MRLIELIEGKVKNAAIDAEYDSAHSRKIAEFGIIINGKLWKRDGQISELLRGKAEQLPSSQTTPRSAASNFTWCVSHTYQNPAITCLNWRYPRNKRSSDAW